MLEKRGSGRTTKQIQNAPEGAFFVVHNQSLRRYAEGLIRSLGRTDIRLITVERSYDLYQLRGLRRHIVIDHAVFKSIPQHVYNELEELQRHMERILHVD